MIADIVSTLPSSGGVDQVELATLAVSKRKTRVSGVVDL